MSEDSEELPVGSLFASLLRGLLRGSRLTHLIHGQSVLQTTRSCCPPGPSAAEGGLRDRAALRLARFLVLLTPRRLNLRAPHGLGDETHTDRLADHRGVVDPGRSGPRRACRVRQSRVTCSVTAPGRGSVVRCDGLAQGRAGQHRAVRGRHAQRCREATWGLGTAMQVSPAACTAVTPRGCLPRPQLRGVRRRGG